MSACVRIAAAALLLAATLPSRDATATEAAAGHYVTGALAGPGAGVVPPEPGLYWSNQELYYSGSLNRSTQLPIGGRLESGLEATFYSASLTGLYIPQLSLGNFTVGMALTLPLQRVDGRVFSGARERSETTTSFGDMVITPAMVGWRPGGGNFVQARLDIFAPTGAYDADAIANVGMNYWTFTPTLAYSHIGARHDVSVSAGIDINTRNTKTDYTSGALLHVDASAIYDLAPGFGVGVMAAVLRQIQDDEGGIADRLNGFRGRAYAIGPIARYNFAIGGAQFSAALAWAPEFAVDKRPEGNTVQFRLSGRF